MKKTSQLMLASMLAFSTLTMANTNEMLGPMPHERTNTPLKSNAHVGRYLYVGTAPKFEGEELELTTSKMSLTMRATGWMTQAKIDDFAAHLYRRWEQIDSTLGDQKFELHPLIKLESLATRDTSIAWAKIAGQYSSHVLENRGVEVYNNKRNANSLIKNGKVDEYHQAISMAILRYFFNNNSLTPEQVKADNKLRDSLISKGNSQKLFQQHYSSVFTPSSAKSGFVGFLTFVYPIAATTAGPFDQPREQVRTLMPSGSVEARWWSDKWDDEFGGLPFILIEPSGVAFHGPITNFEPLDVWYLRRGYVSHGCQRMDSSDLIELRNILPRRQKDLGKVKLTILNYFDVADINNDGKKEVVDVKYYSIPSAVNIPAGKTMDDVIRPYLVQNQMKSYYQNHPYASKMYDPSTDTIQGTPKYKTNGFSLLTDGSHEALPFMRFNYQPSRILQYKELDVQMVPYDDTDGNFPPTYFLNN